MLQRLRRLQAVRVNVWVMYVKPQEVAETLSDSSEKSDLGFRVQNWVGG